MRQSTAYIRASGIDYTYRFCGVTAIEYSFALAIDADTSRGGDIINGARRQPNRIRHLRDGQGLGSLFCIRNTDPPKTADPAEGNLTEFQILWGDTWTG